MYSEIFEKMIAAKTEEERREIVENIDWESLPDHEADPIKIMIQRWVDEGLIS